MSKNKKDKKNGAEKLRKVLDNYSFKELSPQDEKYLKTLKQRLDEQSKEKIFFKKADTSETEESSEEGLLKPTVLIHERVQKKSVKLPEFKEVEESLKEEKKDLDLKEEDDLIDIEKVETSIPEFVEVKQKVTKKEEKTEREVVEEEFVPIDEEEIEKILEEEKPLEEKKETVEFIQVEPEKKQEKEDVKEWEPVDSGEYISEEKEDEIEDEIPEFVEEDEDSKIEVFKDIKSIDSETAIILYNNGYTNLESLKTATEKELRKIKGIKRKTAKQIKEEIEAPEPETWELPTKEEEPEIETIEASEGKEVETSEGKKSDIIIVDETIYCSECGCVVESEMTFCHKCGTRLSDEEEIEKADEEDVEEPSEDEDIKLVTPGKKELTSEEIKKIHDEVPTEEKIKAFEGMKSITYDIAVKLYDNGYTSFDLLKNIDVNDLKRIKGVKSKTAKKIKQEIDEKIIESARVKPIDIGESAEGVVTEEQIKKDTDFEEEKQPLHPVELSHNKEWEPIEEDIESPDEDEIGEEIEKEIQEEIEIKPEEESWEPIEEEEALESIEQELEKEKEEENKKKVEVFKDIKSIDSETAIILYNNGYTNVDSLKTATEKELRKIKGIKRKTAKQIKEEIEAPEPETWELTEDIKETEEKEITKEETKNKETAKKGKIGEYGKIQIFKDLKSVDDSTAIKLYDYGFISLDLLKLADYKELRKVKDIKRKKAKEIIKEIDGLHAEEKIAQMVIEEDAEYFKDEEFFKEEEKQLDHNIKNFEEKEPVLDEELFIEEEMIEELPEEKITKELNDSKEKDEFIKIPSIDKNISELLKENNIKTIEDLKNKTIKDLTKIKGIRKKVAKQIKKEVKEYIEIDEQVEEIPDIEENPYINGDETSEEGEWETFEEPSKKEKKSSKKGFMHGDYNLYEKEIATKNDKKRKVRFFSKGEPEDAEPIKLPKGYEIKENKKTGVPYLKKKK